MKCKALGQSLVEVVVAIGMVSLIVLGLVVATTSSLRTNRFGTDKTLATQYAQEAIELSRKLRDNGWTNFRAYSGTYCLKKNNLWPLPSSTGLCTNADYIDNIYARNVTFVASDPTWTSANSRMEVAVIVSWTDSASSPHTSKLKTYFTKWR